jgi:hypothetical protein
MRHSTQRFLTTHSDAAGVYSPFSAYLQRYLHAPTR